MPDVGQELLNVPFPEMVLKLASAIAEGQYKLDMVSCKIAKFMGDKKQAPVYLPDLTDTSVKARSLPPGSEQDFSLLFINLPTQL